MNMKLTALAAAVVIGLATTLQPAHAQMAVFDPSNFAQNVQQVANMVKQLKALQTQIDTAKSTLTQAQAQVKSITGGRGMGKIVTDASRGYIPRNWNEAIDQQGGSISALADQIKRTAGYLGEKDLSRINPAYRDALRRSGNQAASGMASNAAVFEESGDRFGRLQVLMTQIDGAQDLKAIEDLQARIQVEQVMLQNELIRAQAMNAMIVQQQQVERERQRQKVMSESFDY